ncbi:hypothetical protein RP726_20860 [Candidatus Methylospira mobilis]|uniref:hypothetical protein n=1 Tax=Candidatus Methylospira mobilis TaxID=1808979 RepID=UPI0028EA7A6A|nr:hypothetical protein [Candidatus Methylospira mobilis]WNV04812.1 hypothetical protein RP726_20860 [Candidatus Methylospira mobilis]
MRQAYPPYSVTPAYRRADKRSPSAVQPSAQPGTGVIVDLNTTPERNKLPAGVGFSPRATFYSRAKVRSCNKFSLSDHGASAAPLSYTTLAPRTVSLTKLLRWEIWPPNLYKLFTLLAVGFFNRRPDAPYRFCTQKLLKDVEVIMDFAYLSLIIIFFIVSILFVLGCDILGEKQ